MPKINVIICTYNRCGNVKALLECLLIQEGTDHCPYEIMVVDNNSSDNTKEIVESYVPRFKEKLRYFFEARQGKPFALNLGIKESRGEILAFVDDDCLIEKDYISQVNKVFQEYGTEIDFIGGRIFPHWMGGDCPSWLKKELFDKTEYAMSDERYWRRVYFWGPLAILDYGEKPFPVNSTQETYPSFLFYGLNTAIKKSAFDKVGGYAPKKIITQDTEMCLRLIRSGMKGLYAPNVKVYHRVEAAKLTPEFYYQWYLKRGKFLEINSIAQRKFYHPLGIQNEFILKMCILFFKSMAAKSIQDKVYYRCRALFNLAQMAQIAKRNIV